MNKTTVTELKNDELLIALYWIGIRTANEVNSKRGLTKKTEKEETIILDEISKRFNVDLEQLKRGVIK